MISKGLSSTSVRVLIVEDDARIARAWAGVMRHHGGDVSWAETLEQARERLIQARRSNRLFDMILLDLHLPDGEGVALLDEIRSLPQEPLVAVVSAHLDSQRVTELLARACVSVPKPVTGETLVKLMKTAMKVGYESCVERFAARHKLSPRERAVLLGAVEGHTRKEIAAQLGCMVGTVRTYWERIMNKTGQSSQREILSKLIRESSRRMWG